MSYCRWGEGDVYMYGDVGDLIICCACSFNKPKDDKSFSNDNGFATPKEALQHLYAHRHAGHVVPEYAIERLKEEMEEGK